MIQIKFFASIREKLGVESVNLEYAGEHSVADVANHLLERGKEWQLLTEQNVLCAVNQTLCGKHAQVNDGDEIAFFPPVTGG